MKVLGRVGWWCVVGVACVLLIPSFVVETVADVVDRFIFPE